MNYDRFTVLQHTVYTLYAVSQLLSTFSDQCSHTATVYTETLCQTRWHLHIRHFSVMTMLVGRQEGNPACENAAAVI